MLKSFFVAFNRSPHALAALETTCFLAALTHGKIHVGHVIEIIHEPVLTSGMLTGTIETMAVIPPDDAIREIEKFRREEAAQAQTLLAQGRQVCERWGVGCETLCLSGYLEEEVTLQARSVDLIAIGAGAAGDAGGARRRIGGVMEAIVRASPQPVLIATAPAAPPDGVIVLYDGSERSFHALAAGAEAARLAALPLTLVTAPASREECEALSARACHYLEDYDLQYQAVVIKDREAVERKVAATLNACPAALVLMGAFGESRLREWLTGAAARAVLERTLNPVILFRH